MKIVICGATGNIGQQVLDVAKRFNHEVVGISFNTQVEKAKQLVKQLNIPYYYCHRDPKVGNVNSLSELFVKSKPKMVINALVGYAGLDVSSMVLNHKIDLGLANKESLVMAGHWLNQIASKNKLKIYPIDSEHAALQELVKNFKKKAIKNLIITASGGPFWGYPKKKLKTVTYKQAITHPTWKMGTKISVDSATLANKAFELIEAYHLFNIKNVIAVRHQQSLVHAGIQLVDNSYLFHAATSDMRLPIALCLQQFKTNANTIIRPLDLNNLVFNFEKIDEHEYPFLRIAREVMDKPQTTRGVVFNVANDFAVKLFSEKKITFDQIVTLTCNFYQRFEHKQINGIVTIYATIDNILETLTNTWKEYLNE